MDPRRPVVANCIEGAPEILTQKARQDKLRRMDEPEYLICLQCETPTYQFEYVNGKLATVICNTCGADDVSDFVTETELEEEG